MKPVNQYVFGVDLYRNNGMVFCDVPLYQRQSKGRYQVAAKSETEAKKLLQKAIGFGSINTMYASPDLMELKYKEIRKLVYNHTTHKITYQEVHHACQQESIS